MFEEQSDETGYNKCVRMMNKINGYYDWWLEDLWKK
jgi:hypothetical protein